MGTHFGQEYQALFGSNWLFMRKLSGWILRGMGKYFKSTKDFSEIVKLIKLRMQLRAVADQVYVIFIEANSKIVNSKKVYRRADLCLNLAVLERGRPQEIVRLFLANSDELSQGSSIYSDKKNVEINQFVNCHGVSADILFEMINGHLKHLLNDFEVLLRLNCEGVEHEVISACLSCFGYQLKLVCGSLKDVEELHGVHAAQSLERLLEKSKIDTVDFSSNVNTWSSAFESIVSKFEV